MMGGEISMGMLDALSAEDRVEVKFTDFYSLMKEATKAELLENAIRCDVPHRHIREMMSGKKEINPDANSMAHI